MSDKTLQMMGLTKMELITLASSMGLHLNDSLKKSQMIGAIQQHEASGWMETNKELLHGLDDYSDSDEHLHGFTGYESSLISDAARIAQEIHNAGFGNTMHNIMGGGSAKQVGVISDYLNRLGVSTDDVWKHLPKYNPNENDRHLNLFSAYMRDTLAQNQDMMPPMVGHYASDIMAEYQTPQGNISDSYNYLAHAYLDKSGYSSRDHYNHDHARIAARLPTLMGQQFGEVAYAAVNNVKAGYHLAMPQLGDANVVAGVSFPRQPLNAAGLPLGSEGSAVGDRGHYSLISSLTGRPEGSDDLSKTLRTTFGNTLKSMAHVYTGGDVKKAIQLSGGSYSQGDIGLNARYNMTSEFDSIMDTATRYMSIEDARSGYANSDYEYQSSARTLASMNRNSWDVDSSSSSPSSQDSNFRMSSSTSFITDLSAPTSYNAARDRREARAIADLDASYANFRDVADGTSYSSNNPVRFHDDIQQGSEEWLNMRKQYDFTGSTVGSFLGNNPYTRPWQELVDKIGVVRGSGKSNAYKERMFAQGHQSEDEARGRVESQYGLNIRQTGFVTNDEYPNMLYSPDGLIGDDAIWEHKALINRKEFYNDLKTDNGAYYDQLQMGMLVTGRNRALYSESLGQETRSQWIDRDPNWYNDNETKLNSISARLARGREFMESLPPDADKAQIYKGARQAVIGSGLWSDVRGARSGINTLAGTDQDEFLRNTIVQNRVEGRVSNGYVPNFTMPESNSGNVTGSSAESVKQGILEANDELARRNASGSGSTMSTGLVVAGGGSGNGSGGTGGSQSGDADFGGGENPYARFARYTSGGVGGGGGNSPPSGPSNPIFDANRFFDSMVAGVQGGSLRSAQGGFMRGLANSGTIGSAAVMAAGMLNIAGETIDTMNDYLGTAQDFGTSNATQFDAQQQGLEMMGLNKNQAQSMNERIHSAYIQMMNGDPRAAVAIVVASRGTISMNDIRESKGDSNYVAGKFVQNNRRDGVDEATVAGRAQMSGLNGLARAYHTNSDDISRAIINERSRADDDLTELQDVRHQNAQRAYASPDYFVQRMVALGYDKTGMGLAANGMEHSVDALGLGTGHFDPDSLRRGTDYGVPKWNMSASEFVVATEQLESGGNRNARSKTSTAFGSMQTLDGTRRDPGYGVTPAKDDSPEEARRVGVDYAVALHERYGGNTVYAAAAYVAGPRAFDNARKQYGDDWIDHINPQAQKRVKDIIKLEQGADTFKQTGSSGGNGVTVNNLNVTADIKFNGRAVQADVTSSGHNGAVRLNKAASVDSRK